jgi:hypothetical protein
VYPKAFRSHAWGCKVESHVVRSPVVQAFCAFMGGSSLAGRQEVAVSLASTVRGQHYPHFVYTATSTVELMCLEQEGCAQEQQAATQYATFPWRA